LFWSCVADAQYNMCTSSGTISGACGGTFYDSGGPAGNYNNNENCTVSFCAPAGQYISFDFTVFNTESFFDELSIYNGPTTASPLLGTFSGTTGPGVVTSTLGGCITFQFSSDGSTKKPGWEAAITCTTTPPSTGNDCSSASPFCTGTVYNFPNNTNVPSLGTINCLFSTPNPVWYYMQIQNPGSLDIDISQSDAGGAGIDVDFNLWGPFSSVSDGCTQISNGTAPNVDCSFSFSTTEQANIPNAQAGEIYIMLLTNYSNSAGSITFSNTNTSTATTNCDILCNITDVTAVPTVCNSSTNTYAVSGQVFFTNAPTSGNLLITNSCGGSVTIPGPFTSPVNYTINGVLPTGAGCNITAVFSADQSCSFTQSYTSPAPCVAAGLNCPQYATSSTSPSVACGGQIYNLEVANTACNGTITFSVQGNYGSSFASEITWTVTSVATGAVVASGGPGTNGTAINATVGPLNPALVGTIFDLHVYDSFGDGFNGTGGTIYVQQPLGTSITSPITGSFGDSSHVMFGTNIAISPATMTVNTPTGVITTTVNNCRNFKIPITLQNTNYCSTATVNLPWSIVCQANGAVLSSGTQTVTVFPNLPSSAGDLVDIKFDTTSCTWTTTPNSGCTNANIGSVFTITPNPSTLPPPTTCGSGGQTFEVVYNGLSGSPNCCSTGGPLVPITLNQTYIQSNFSTGTSPFWSTSNHAAHLTIPANNIGGDATSLTLNVNVNGYCFNQPGANNPAATSFWVTIIVDGQIVLDQVSANPAPTNATYTLNLANIPSGFDQNSVIEIYIYPNSYAVGGVNTVFNPNTSCPIPNAQDGEWTASLTSSIDASFTEKTPTPGISNFKR